MIRLTFILLLIANCCLHTLNSMVVASNFDESEVVAGIDSELLSKIVKEAVQELQRKASVTCGTSTYEGSHYHHKNGKTPLENTEISISGEDCAKVVRTELGRDVVEVINGGYAFVLTRAKDGKYSIAGVQRKGISQEDDLLIREKLNLARCHLLDAYCFVGRTVWGLVNDPGFKMNSIEAFDDETGEVRVKVKFNYSPTGKPYEGVNGIDDWTLDNAYMVFAPSKGWRIVEYGRPEWPTTILTVNNHPPNQLAFTKGSVARFYGKEDGKVKQEKAVNAVRWSYESIPKEHFYLSHYGFPEPNFDSAARWPWIVGGLALGAICIVASRRLLRR